MTPLDPSAPSYALTSAEAQAILIADEAFVASYEVRLACGPLLGIEEREAWVKLVERAAVRISELEVPADTMTAAEDSKEGAITEIMRG